MRITQGMLTQQMLLDMQSNYARLSELQDETASGKRINKPSDDPVGVGFVMRYKAQIAYYDQYKDNADQAKGWLDYTDTMLGQAGDVMQRARELAVRGASDSMSATARQSTAMEVDQLYQQMVTIGNSQYNGKFIFNGQQTLTKPYPSTNAESATTNAGQVVFDVGDSVQMPVNMAGNTFFGNPTDTDNAFAVLQTLKDGLNNNDTTKIQTALSQIDTRFNIMLEQRSDIGSRSNRMELMQNRLSDQSENAKSLLSDTQDADMAKVITDLKTAENVHEASLEVGARVMLPTLLDFLK